jgi:hypothetical protein
MAENGSAAAKNTSNASGSSGGMHPHPPAQSEARAPGKAQPRPRRVKGSGATSAAEDETVQLQARKDQQANAWLQAYGAKDTTLPEPLEAGSPPPAPSRLAASKPSGEGALPLARRRESAEAALNAFEDHQRSAADSEASVQAAEEEAKKRKVAEAAKKKQLEAAVRAKPPSPNATTAGEGAGAAQGLSRCRRRLPGTRTPCGRAQAAASRS